MPVSTRSQIKTDPNQNQIDPNQNPLRNPHHGLKEKMRALTLLYEQQKHQQAFKNPPEPQPPRLSSHPSVDLLSCSGKRGGGGGGERKESPNVMREKNTNNNNNNINTVISRTYSLPQPPLYSAKENAGDRAMGLLGPRKAAISTTVARKLSMGAGVEGRGAIGSENLHEMVMENKQLEGRGVIGSKNLQEIVVESKQGGESGGGSRILVFVRLRPLAKKERESGSRCCVRIVNRRDVYLTEFATENDYLRLKRLRGRHFTFDASFPDSATQLEVYSTTTAELVEAVLEGRNGSVFCYGATGAGKTYTMLGTVENPGVMVLAIKDLFSKIRQRSCDGNHVVHLSYLEVYNETVRDLLSPGRPLVLREDKQGIVAAGLTQFRAYSTDEVMALLQQGNQNRTTEPTRANETSSRSHAILQVMVEYRVKDASNKVVNRVGKLSLIDLAGSERALATDQRTLRSLEGANINKSLLALSSCINALVEGKKHIPFRNSKLTQLLKDSLGGACNTVMIANISPSNHSFGETQNTLHWADRAKEIRTKAYEANEEILQVAESGTDQAKLLLELQKENRDLRVQLARQQQKLLSTQAQSLAAHASPTPSSISSLLSTPPTAAKPNETRKPRSTLTVGGYFTPESKNKGAEETVNELRRTVKALETEIERMRKDHSLQIKQKDDLIRNISRKGAKAGLEGSGAEGSKRVVTRASLRPKQKNEGELKSPNHRFLSPAPTAKKRSIWDITTGNSPSLLTLNSKKTRSHVINDPPGAPSMLLQPGFARQRTETWK